MRFFSGIILIMALSGGCQSRNQSFEDTGTTDLEARLQRLWFPVFYPAEELEDWLNRKFDRVIADTFIPYGNDSLLLKVAKPGRIKLTMTGDSVDVVFPLEVEVTEDRQGWSGKKVHRRFTGALNLHLNVVPDVNTQWEISTRTVLRGYRWTKRPRMETGGIKIGVRFIADYLLRNELRDLPAAIDEALQEKVDLKKGLARVWTNLQKPLPVYRSDSSALWFMIEPDSLWGDIVTNARGLVFNLAVDARVRIHPDSARLSTRKPLPDFRPLKQMYPDSSTLEILATIPLAVVNRELKKIGKDYSSDRSFIFPEIREIKMRGYGKMVAFDLQTGGNIPAALTVVGTPAYKSETRTLVVRNADYELNTDHKVLSALNRGLRESILRYVENRVVLDIGEYMDDLPEYLNKSVNDGNSSDHFRLLFSDLEVKDIRHAANDNELLIWLSCKPRFEITLKKLPVKKRIQITAAHSFFTSPVYGPK